MIPLPSASKLDLAAKCAGSAALPRVGRISVAAVAGQTAHASLEADPKKASAILDAVGLAVPNGAVIRQEAAFLYDVRSGAVRFLGYGRESYGTANPPRGEYEIGATLDYLAQGNGEALVADWKAGQARLVGPAGSSYQLGVAALIAERPTVRAAFVFVKDDGEEWADRVQLDAFDLADWRDKLRALADRVKAAQESVAAGSMPALTEGDHCRWCPVAPTGTCPALVGLVKAALSEDPADLRERVESAIDAGTLDPADASTALDRVQKRIKALRYMEDRLHAYARIVPLPRPGGKVLTEIRTSSERVVDAGAAHQILAARYGEEIANAACPRESSKSAIKDATAGARGRGELAALERELRQAGALAKVDGKPRLDEVEPDDPRILDPGIVAMAMAGELSASRPATAEARA